MSPRVFGTILRDFIAAADTVCIYSTTNDGLCSEQREVETEAEGRLLV